MNAFVHMMLETNSKNAIRHLRIAGYKRTVSRACYLQPSFLFSCLFLLMLTYKSCYVAEEKRRCYPGRLDQLDGLQTTRLASAEASCLVALRTASFMNSPEQQIQHEVCSHAFYLNL
jgi:hypothetical protein